MQTITGKNIVVVNEGGTEIPLTIGQLKLVSYPKAVASIDDEIGLTAILAGLEKQAVLELTPESYETLRAATAELNEKGFFVYAQRQVAKATERINKMSPEMLKAVTEKVLPTLPPGLLPKAA